MKRSRPHRRPGAPLLLLIALTGSGCFSACPSSEDSEARERIWGPEEPAPEVVAATEKLDIANLSTATEVRRRVLWMPAAEMAHRLGSFSANNTVNMDWRRGDERVTLQESIILQQAKNGDFRVLSENDAGLGMELRWVSGVVYVQNRLGKFFERRADRAGHLAWRETAMEQLATVLTLARGKIALAELGATTYEGRSAHRFALTSAEEVVAGAEPPARPDWAHDPVYAEGGPEDSLKNRLAVKERGEVESVSGDLVVDAQTGVPLRFSLTTKLSVAPPEGAGGEPAHLELKISRRLSGIGASQLVERPEHEPFSGRPRAIMDPLDWWPDAVAAKKKAEAEAAAQEKEGE
ncbi:MAG: hypothetical protein P1V51_14715 [Deltaproteobacteria bacterium]|nr:hypothetical protein [Deltaproteobacteria bacterium]